MNYSEKLKAIGFFRIHPSYLPFIGTEYEKYKLLQISESHYYIYCPIQWFRWVVKEPTKAMSSNKIYGATS